MHHKQDILLYKNRLPKFNNQSNERLVQTKHGHVVQKSIKVLKSIRVVVIVQAGGCVVQAPGTTKATVRTASMITFMSKVYCYTRRITFQSGSLQAMQIWYAVPFSHSANGI
jgi:uncharacterized membrane protein